MCLGRWFEVAESCMECRYTVPVELRENIRRLRPMQQSTQGPRTQNDNHALASSRVPAITNVAEESAGRSVRYNDQALTPPLLRPTALTPEADDENQLREQIRTLSQPAFHLSTEMHWTEPLSENPDDTLLEWHWIRSYYTIQEARQISRLMHTLSEYLPLSQLRPHEERTVRDFEELARLLSIYHERYSDGQIFLELVYRPMARGFELD
jgi:hypothetical protein